MSSETFLTIILATASVAITAIAFIGSLKEGRDSFRKLNEHLDQKEKAKSQNHINAGA